MTESALFRVIYTSHNRVGADPAMLRAAVRDILTVARRENARARITGALLYNTAGFAQVLEGSLPAVTATFERIQRDPRHGDVQVLDSGPLLRRGFADWRMALAEDGAPPLGRLDLGTATAEEVLALLSALIVPEPASPVRLGLPDGREAGITVAIRPTRRPEDVPA